MSFIWIMGGTFALFFLLVMEVFAGRRATLVFAALFGGVACQTALGEAATTGVLPSLAANLGRLLVPVWMLDFLCGFQTKWPRATTRPALAGLALALCLVGFLLRDDGERSHGTLLLTLFCLDFAVFLVAGGLLGGARQRDQEADDRLEALVAARSERAAANSYAKRRPAADWLNRPAAVFCLVVLLTVPVVLAMRVFDLPVHPLAVLAVPPPAWLGLRLGLRAEARQGPRFRAYALDSRGGYLFKVLVQGLFFLPFYAVTVVGLCGLPGEALRLERLVPPFEALAQSLLGVELAYAAGLATGALLLRLFGNPFPPKDEALPPETPDGLNDPFTREDAPAPPKAPLPDPQARLGLADDDMDRLLRDVESILRTDSLTQPRRPPRSPAQIASNASSDNESLHSGKEEKSSRPVNTGIDKNN